MESFEKYSLLLLALFAISCSTGDTAESGETTPESEAAQEATVEPPTGVFDKLAEADLEEVRLTESRTVLTVDAQVKGAQGTFVVDTSSSNHVLTREFAESHDIIFTEPTQPMPTEATRGSAPASAVETTTLEVGGDRIEADEMLAKPREAVFPDLPEVERVNQFAGVLSPQNLYDVKTRYTTLDLDENKLIGVDAEPAGVKAWLRVRFGAREFETIERREGMAPELPHIRAEVNGDDQEALVLLDTSAGESVFKSTILGVADREMSCVEPGQEGCRVVGVRAQGQTVELGELESPEFTAVGTTSTLEHTGVDGVLGRDAMQHFVWVFPADDDKAIKIARADQRPGE